jgi:hypothetical protein
MVIDLGRGKEKEQRNKSGKNPCSLFLEVLVI